MQASMLRSGQEFTPQSCPFEGPSRASTCNSKCPENLQPRGLGPRILLSNWLRQAKELVVVQSIYIYMYVYIYICIYIYIYVYIYKVWTHLEPCQITFQHEPMALYFCNPGGWIPGRISAVLRSAPLWSGR